MVKQISEGEYIRRLIRDFGADIQVKLNPVPDPTPAQRRQTNATLYNVFHDREIYGYEFSQQSPTITVVWDYAQPFKSPSRGMMRRTLAEFDVWDEHVNHLWAVPEVLGRAPLAPELATYRTSLLKALVAAGSRYVMLVGSRPVWCWRPEMRLSETAGKPFVWRSQFLIMPVPNPLSASHNKTEYGLWRRMVGKFCGYIRDGEGIDILTTVCIKCKEPVYWYDSDGVPWCREHVEDGVKAQTKGVKEWQTLSIQAGNVALPLSTD